jgi:hypothetical protein
MDDPEAHGRLARLILVYGVEENHSSRCATRALARHLAALPAPRIDSNAAVLAIAAAILVVAAPPKQPRMIFGDCIFKELRHCR